MGTDPLKLNLTTMGGAVAMACYDIVGKALGVPAYRLMGTKHFDKVPVGWWSPPLEPAEFAAMAEEGARLGYKTHKLKARPWNIVETVKLMSEVAGPDYGIIVDPNFSFGDISTSLRLARQLEPYNIQAFEDPFRYLPGWHQYHHFRQHSIIPLAPHLGDPKLVMSAIRADAADMFNMGGSVESVLIMAGMAEAAGRRPRARSLRRLRHARPCHRPQRHHPLRLPALHPGERLDRWGPDPAGRLRCSSRSAGSGSGARYGGGGEVPSQLTVTPAAAGVVLLHRARSPLNQIEV